MRLVLVLLGVQTTIGPGLASDLDLDMLRIQRNLLQEKTVEDIPKVRIVEKIEEEPPIEITKGPERFYFENGKLPKLLMSVKEGIQVTVFKNGAKWDTFLLDQEATGGITGSKNNPDSNVFQVDIDWKKQTFTGQKDPSKKINGLQLEMKFDMKKGSFILTHLRIVNLAVEGKFEDVRLHVVTRHGYRVEAPVGLAFGCSQPGMFEPNTSNKTETKTTYTAGLTFPELNLQVYQVNRGRFGPIWECGELIPIGLWVGIFVSLFFALVCAWGFTMLSNIHTMDRFDDPKGKSIYIPQTD